MPATLLNSTVPKPDRAPAAERPAERYLTVRLGPMELGIRVFQVREISGVEEILALPRMPQHVMGVIYRGGRAVPVVDLRLKFGLPDTGRGRGACLVVVQTGAGAQSAPVGVVVDAVSEVRYLATGEIEPPRGWLGLAQRKRTAKILLDIDSLLRGEELKDLARFGASAGGRANPFRKWIS